MGLSRRIGQVRALSLRQWRDLAISIWELGLANRKLAKGGSVSKIVQSPPTGPFTANPSIVARVSWAIPHAASVVPWRSDCLRQATAASRWLLRHDIPTEIRLGARKESDGSFAAHAWLLCDGEVLIGGTEDDYQEFD